MKSILESLSEGRTLSGEVIILNKISKTNWTRGKAIQLQQWLVTALWDSEIDAKVLEQTLAKFRKAISDKKHYGDNSPQKFTYDRKPLYPNPTFNYWDFFTYSLSGSGDGFRGLARELRLDASVSYKAATGIIGLLLVDSAINHLIDGDPNRACADIFDATQAFDEMTYPGSRLDIPRLGGKKKGEKTSAEALARERKVADLEKKLISQGHPPRSLNKLIARQIELSPGSVRKIRARSRKKRHAAS